MHLKSDTLLKRGEYRIVDSLGRGGFGITYLAEQVNLHRKVCIKEFFPKDYYKRDEDSVSISLLSDGFAESMNKFKAKFVKEAQTIATLNHANIIPIHDVFEENGTAYYVMDYIEGESLSERVKRGGAMSERDAVAYIKQVASALEHIHEQQIMHLDVKPGNIMVRSKDDHAILIDFGLSKHYDATSGEATSTTPVGVSHGYAPMEQYRPGGVSTFSPETDIYSLGATLYYLVTGSVPPLAADIADDGLPALPTHLSHGVRTAIERSMTEKRKDRPHTIKEFLALLDSDADVEITIIGDNDSDNTRVADGESEDDDSTPNPPPKRKKRLWWLWLLGLLLIGGVAYLMFKGDDKPTPISNTTNTAKPQQPTPNKDFTVRVGDVSFKMIWVEGGRFDMGSPAGVGYSDEEPRHRVTLDGYWIAETEVTQGLWRAVMNGKDEGWTTEYGKGPDYPAYYVSYAEAIDFCKELNAKTNNKYNFTLPTEAQWEYAARGGNKSRGFTYSGSNTLDNVAWYWGNSNGNNGNTYGTHEVKTRSSNELGIYDMSGNVYEWCSDWYSSKYYSESGNLHNPQGPSTGGYRVLRGGSWNSNAEYCRVAYRYDDNPGYSYGSIGFRLAVSSSL